MEVGFCAGHRSNRAWVLGGHDRRVTSKASAVEDNTSEAMVTPPNAIAKYLITDRKPSPTLAPATVAIVVVEVASAILRRRAHAKRAQEGGIF